jgi:serine/threonine protein kinase
MKKQNQQFSQEFIEKIICDLFNPLGIMHSRSVVHRDISPCNLLIKQHNRNGTVDIVLNDFDFVFEMGTAAHTKVGKERYMAPEISSGNYETKVDIWSAGVTLIELMTLSKRHRLNTMTEHNEEQMHDRLRAQLVKKHCNITNK